MLQRPQDHHRPADVFPRLAGDPLGFHCWGAPFSFTTGIDGEGDVPVVQNSSHRARYREAWARSYISR